LAERGGTTTDLVGVDPQPRYSFEDPDDVLTPEEEAVLRSACRITDTDVELLFMSSYDPDAMVELWTEATIPFFIFFPRILHTASWQITADGVAGPLQVETVGYNSTFPEDDWNDNINLGLSCGDADFSSASVDVTTEHRARWQAFTAAGLLHIDSDPVTGGASGDCIRESEWDEVPGDGWVGEGDCEFCQEWLLYEDGVLVDEWWECWPLGPDDPYYEYCEEVTQ